MRGLLAADTALVGIWSGGAWLAERLQRDLRRAEPHGVISSTLHRDDFSARGLAGGTDPTQLPFDVDGRPILLVDDVLYTGRTVRAVINELFDYGRPASVASGGAGRPRRTRAADRAGVRGGARRRCRRRSACRWRRTTAGRFVFSIEERNDAG